LGVNLKRTHLRLADCNLSLKRGYELFNLFHSKTFGMNCNCPGLSVSPIGVLLKGCGWPEIFGMIGVLQYLFSLSIPINSNIPLIILSISGVFVALSANHCFSSYKSPLILSIIAFLLSVVVSSLFSMNIEKSFILSMSFFPAMLVFFLIIEVFNINFAYLISGIFSLLSLVISTSALVVFFIANSGGPLFWVKEISNVYMIVPNDLVLVSVLIPFSFVLLFKGGGSPFGIIPIISILTSMAAVIIYESRIGIVAAIISIFCVVLILFKQRLTEIFLASTSLLILVDWIHGFQIINKFENIWQSRIFIWIVGWEMFADSFLVGQGPHTFGQLYFQYRNDLDLPKWILVDERWMPWAHNLYLEILIEQGIIGFLCFGIVIVSAFLTLSRLLKTQIGDVRILSAGIFACFSSIVVAAFCELSFIRHWVVILLFSVLGLIHALSCSNSRSLKGRDISIRSGSYRK
jgi:O-antigen ligase